MKEKRRSRLWILSLSAALVLTLTGCGSSYDSVESAVTQEAAYDNAAGLSKAALMADTGAYEAMPAEEVAEEGDSTQIQVPSDRKLIRTVNLSAETKGFDSLLFNIQNRVAALGGYIQDYSVSGSQGNRYGYVTARVPADRLDSFVDEVREQANVVSQSESTEDVTLQYVDLESHKKALLTEQERLLELMEQAENVSDIIEIEARLGEVRYQLESMESQLRTFDNRIDYSTVYIDISETDTITPASELSVFEKMGAGFMNSLYEVGDGLKTFAVNFVIYLPYIILWIIVILIFALAARLIIKAVNRSRVRKGVQGKQLKMPAVFTKRSGQPVNPAGDLQQNTLRKPEIRTDTDREKKE